MTDNTPDNQLTDNPEAEAVFLAACRQHKALITTHAQVMGLKDAVSAPLAMVAAVVEQHPEDPGLKRWTLAFLDRLRVQVEASGMPRQ